jgi:hypothetical protein
MTPSQRPILPAPAVSAAEASVAQPRQQTDGSLVQKRTAINTACNACRSRRSKVSSRPFGIFALIMIPRAADTLMLVRWRKAALSALSHKRLALRI